MKRYRKKPTSTVVAVQLNLEMRGFSYKKWGHTQHCKAGDWVVKNQDDTYTIDANSFGNTYTELSPGIYYKSGKVFAEKSALSGTIKTREGSSEYQAGDYLVFNNADRNDGYAVGAAEFESMYEPVE